jgi:hypothetical protein
MSFDPVTFTSSNSTVSTNSTLDSSHPGDNGRKIRPNPLNYRNKTWAQAAGSREVSAPLAKLPEDVSFPECFPEPIHYDAARHLLMYRGFMTNSSYVELQKLSRNLDYTRALEKLFTASAQDPVEQKPATPWIVLGIIGTALVAVATLVWRMMG